MEAKDQSDTLFKLMLVLVRDRKAMQGRIRSVGYTREYGELPPDLGVYTLSNLQADEIRALADRINMRKMKPLGAKSDIYLNDVGYVIYNLTHEPPVIMDGVTRDGMEAVCQQAGAAIEELDACISEYQRLRADGTIGEEVANTDLQSPFRSRRELLEPIIRYYLFEGSESGMSMFPAECAIDYVDPLNTNTWSVYEPEEMMDLIWDRLVFAVKELDSEDADGNGEAGEEQAADAWTPLGGSVGKVALYIRVGEAVGAREL